MSYIYIYNKDIDERPLETDGRDLYELKQVSRV